MAVFQGYEVSISWSPGQPPLPTPVPVPNPSKVILAQHVMTFAEAQLILNSGMLMIKNAEDLCNLVAQATGLKYLPISSINPTIRSMGFA